MRLRSNCVPEKNRIRSQDHYIDFLPLHIILHPLSQVFKFFFSWNTDVLRLNAEHLNAFFPHIYLFRQNEALMCKTGATGERRQ